MGLSNRKILIGIAISILAVLFLVFILWDQSGQGTENPIKLIPQDAALVIRVNNDQFFHKLFKKQSPIWEEIGRLGFLQEAYGQLAALDSVINTNPNVHHFFDGTESFVSLHANGASQFEMLITLIPPAGMTDREKAEIMQSMLHARILLDASRKYEGIDIIAFQSKISGRKYFLAEVDNIIQYSTSSILIEEAIRQSSLNSSLLDSPAFFKVYQTSGKNKDANFYVSLKHLNQVLSQFSNTTIRKKLAELTYIGTWSELDLNLNPNQILLNGLLREEDSVTTIMSLIGKSDPVRITVDKIFTDDVSFFYVIGSDNIPRTYQNYVKLLRYQGMYTVYSRGIESVNAVLQCNIEKTLQPLINNELALVHRSIGVDKGATYVVMHCNSGSEAISEFEALLKRYYGNNSDYQYTCKLDNSLSRTIYKMPVDGFCGKVFGPLFDFIDKTYFTKIDNYIVFGESVDYLKDFLYQNTLKNTLETDIAYKEFQASLAGKSYVLLYNNLGKAQGFYGQFLADNIQKIWESELPNLQKLRSAGFQIGEVSKMPYVNFMLNYIEDVYEEPQTVWESQLDTSFSFKPVFLTNHYTNQKEIFIQDYKNSIYLINQSGRILWKQPLGEAINSEVYQVDYYKNGKLQILFSTSNYLHLIDRNGNYIERYPVRLRESASAGMSLFDYDNNLDYRIFIPGADKKVYAYSKEGTLVTGWQFDGAEHQVNNPLQHVRIGAKDFIVLKDKNKVYFLDRRGSNRVKPQKQVRLSDANNIYIENTGQLNTSFIVTTDTTGGIVKFFFDGSVKEQVLDETFSHNHRFAFYDITADGKDDYVMLENGQLRVWEQNGKPVYKCKTTATDNILPMYYQFSASDRKLGLVSVEEQKIYLIDNDGKNYKGFPLSGNTAFSIGFLEPGSTRFNLLVGGRNNFLYNYFVH